MPHMFPEFIDKKLVPSLAEITLYTEFKKQLSDNFYVFHSSRWLGIRYPGTSPSDGETDFVVAHPKMGVLLIEVKGGIIGLDEKNGWYTIRRDTNELIRIKDPLSQVIGNKYALNRKIQSLPNWQGPVPTLGHAIAFPDGTVDLFDLGQEAPREIVLLHENLSDLDKWVRNCMAFWKGEGAFRPPGEYGVQALRDLLARSWLLREPRIAEVINFESTAIDRYTEEQYQILEILDGRPRAAIRGCAGSGKTMLAIKKARELAQQGFDVLLICYNRNLANELRASAGILPRLKIQNFHSLCKEYAMQTGYDKKPLWDESAPDFFSKIMPDAIFEAVATGKSGLRFDAIIADEGQDFEPEWWDNLEMLLRDPERGLFYIFYDDNQLLYNHKLTLPVKEIPFNLTKNCRNTRQIHQAVTCFYRSDLKLHSNGPDGRPIRLSTFENTGKSLRAVLTEIIARLVFADGINTNQIVLISPKGKKSYPLSEIEDPLPFHLEDKVTDRDNFIYCTTIRLFKGLERPVVILLVPDDSEGWFNELMYVGLSRGQNHIEILASKQTEINLISLFQQAHVDFTFQTEPF